MSTNQQFLVDVLEREKSSLVENWVLAASGPHAPAKVRSEAAEIFSAFLPAIQSADAQNSGSAAWQPVKSALERLSASRAAQGSTAGSTSAFVLALKQPIFEALQRELAADSHALVDAIGRVSFYVDALAQWTVDAYQRTREQLISRQQEELLELSTPVIKLWDGVLAVPMIGTLDSSRTQLVMESLLQRIVETESALAIIDITGVPTVDTLVAQHLLKTVTAIRLMGADCIICGIRPQIAQTIVHLGIDLNSVTTKATLADALALAMKRNGYVFTKTK
ncbi:STAS domain-containing protein [Comamonas koreensis]|uniref:STAS domain-containing protein n=1 Tax=Comamonas koreensis TaxID=160825 RepID=A0AAW4XYE5_9BURK|nr:STAS domain-containing protein [Comamonas koreensis]MCD2166156.1 STAS domain-containing protein [Comamonas koreensis]